MDLIRLCRVPSEGHSAAFVRTEFAISGGNWGEFRNAKRREKKWFPGSKELESRLRTASNASHHAEQWAGPRHSSYEKG
jgi:hypothetical protein